MGIVADDLRRILSEVCDLGLEGLQFCLVCDFFKVDAVLVGERVEDVDIFDCVLASLLVAVDEVDPVTDVFRNIVAF